MTQYYLKLALPADPLRHGWEWERRRIIVHGYDIVLDPHTILNDHTLHTLRSWQLDPCAVVIFGHCLHTLEPKHKLIHSDIRWDGSQWQPWLYGINWEIPHSECRFTWWDMGDYQAVLPEPPSQWNQDCYGSTPTQNSWISNRQQVQDYQPSTWQPLQPEEQQRALEHNLDQRTKFLTLHGVHYQRRGRMGIPPRARLVARTVIDQPTLVRTDVPHQTSYHSSSGWRIGISVRCTPRPQEDWHSLCQQLTDQGAVSRTVIPR